MRACEFVAELTGIKQHTSQIGDADPWAPYETNFDEYPEIGNQSIQYREILIKHGFSEIGWGDYASVWVHPSRPNEVLKVFTTNDRGYRNWVDICQLHRGNPNLPKFFSSKPRKLTKDFMAVRTELLKDSEKFWSGHFGQQVGRFVKNCARGNIGHGLDKPSTSIQDMKDYLESAPLDHNGRQRFDMIKDYLAKDPGFLKALWILTIAIRENKGTPDLQGANLMMRGKTCVLADPLS